MADNVAITAGSGVTIGADDVGGVLYQRVKLQRGADGKASGDIQFAAIDCSSSGANTIVAADASNHIRVIAYVLTGSAAVNARWKSAATNLSGLLYVDTKGGVAATSVDGLFQTAINEALVLDLSSAVAVGGHIAYIKET